MKQIIVDCDPGVDDSVALSLIRAGEMKGKCKCIGVTVVHGNSTDAAQLMANTRFLTKELWAGVAEPPVAMGSSIPYVDASHHDALFVHGVDGMGGVVGVVSSKKRAREEDDASTVGDAPDESALELMIRLLRGATERVDILALGPLTNIALLLRSSPDLCRARLGVIYVMGGSIAHPGNARMLGEANFVNDAHAAQVVMTSWPRVVLAPLNMTHQILLTDDAFWHRLRDECGSVGDMLYRVSRQCLAYMNKDCGLNLIHGHDPAAAMAFLGSTAFTDVTAMSVQVDTVSELNKGTVVADLRITRDRETEPEYTSLSKNVQVLLGVKNDQIVTEMVDLLRQFAAKK
jgi:inosine-uridine nucleoside N-ribohydrolase